ncbi:hypothetical protein [Thermocrinis sp.]|jgi:hypothetical protein|uniref:hypothetical protein n=1 Tax=Thermocrinis sp. TaxID=2024383 RepID=UPI003C0DAD55
MIYVTAAYSFKVEEKSSTSPNGHILRIVPIDPEDLREVLYNWPCVVSEEAARVIKEKWGWEITPKFSGFLRVKPGDTIITVWPEAILEISVIT